MREDSPYRYEILVQDRRVGPFDRRTIVGMFAKKLLERGQMVLRNDGVRMSVAELVKDRFEMTDRPDPARQPAPGAGTASGLWPTFLVDFGGGLRPGAFGFIGQGEMRYQGDLLRLTGRRRSGLIASSVERIKVPWAAVARVEYHGLAVSFHLKPNAPYDEARRGEPAVIRFENDFAIQELKDLLGFSG